MSDELEEPEGDAPDEMQWVLAQGYVRNDKPTVLLRIWDGNPLDPETKSVSLKLDIRQVDVLMNLLWTSEHEAINAYAKRVQMFDELDKDLEEWANEGGTPESEPNDQP